MTDLIEEHVNLLQEARRERDHWKQHAADLSKWLSDEQDLNTDLLAALTGHESPQLWRIEWLAGLVQTLEEGGVNQLRAEWDEDPSAMSEMLLELRGMITDARAAIRKASAEGKTDV